LEFHSSSPAIAAVDFDGNCANVIRDVHKKRDSFGNRREYQPLNGGRDKAANRGWYHDALLLVRGFDKENDPCNNQDGGNKPCRDPIEP